MSQSEYLAEAEVIGRVFADNRVLDEVSGYISPSDFSTKSLSTIWSQCLSMYANGETIEPVSLANSLEKSGSLTECGGISFILSLDNQVSGTLGPNHAKIIKSGSRRRRIISACNGLDSVTRWL